MDELWYEEELFPFTTSDETLTKSLSGKYSHLDEQEVRATAHCILRVDKPRWMKLPPEQVPLRSDTPGEVYLVRLGFQFDLPPESLKKGMRFHLVRCLAFLWSTKDTQPPPSIYKVIPEALYDGQPRQVILEFLPTVKIANLVEVSPGKVSTDITIGIVEPEVVGWTGEQERNPYWNLRPQSKMLLGVRHFWFVMEKPLACESVQLALKVVAQLQTRFGLISIAPESATRLAITVK